MITQAQPATDTPFFFRNGWKRLYRIVWWLTAMILAIYSAIAGSKGFWPGSNTVIDVLLAWSYPHMQTILVCTGVGQLLTGIVRSRIASHEHRVRRQDIELHKNGLIRDIIGDQIVQIKEQLSDDGSDHDMKITVFVKDGNRLIPIQRAGGVDGAQCGHTFPTSGMYPGVAGKAFQQGIAVSVYDLPDLHNLPPGKRQRSRILATYATQTFQRQTDVEGELAHKIGQGRHMPRAFCAARITSGTRKNALGVVVVDMARSSLTEDEENEITYLAIILEPLLRRLPHDRIRR